jgi:DNA-binding transcriptional regulator YhcF (GntR family)
MMANKSIENAVYRNALLLAVASREEGPSERFLAETLQASRHTLQKAYIDGTGENF